MNGLLNFSDEDEDDDLPSLDDDPILNEGENIEEFSEDSESFENVEEDFDDEIDLAAIFNMDDDDSENDENVEEYSENEENVENIPEDDFAADEDVWEGDDTGGYIDDAFTPADNNDGSFTLADDDDDGDFSIGAFDEDEENVSKISEPFGSDEMLEIENEEPEDENDDEFFDYGDNAESKPEENGSIVDRLKQKLQNIKKQIAADVRGEDYDPKNDEEPEIEPEEEEEDRPEDVKPKASGGKKSFLSIFALPKKLFSPIFRAYRAVANFIFTILIKVLQFLGKLPLIGRLFRWLASLTKILQIISTSLPILLIIAVLFVVNARAVPSETVIDFPDEGSAIFQEFNFDESSRKASGKFVNTGEIVLDFYPSFTVYSMQYSFNPVSWVIPKQQFICEGKEPERLDIGESRNITVTCSKGAESGFFPRTVGNAEPIG